MKVFCFGDSATRYYLRHDMCPIDLLREQQLIPGVSLGIFLAHLWNYMFSNKSLCFPHSKGEHLPLNDAVCCESKFSQANICCSSPASPRAYLHDLGRIFQPQTMSLRLTALPEYQWEGRWSEKKYCKSKKYACNFLDESSILGSQAPSGTLHFLTKSSVLYRVQGVGPCLVGRKTRIK